MRIPVLSVLPALPAARWMLAVMALALVAGCALPARHAETTPRAHGVPAGMVSVTYADPAGFAEAREQTPHEPAAARRAWMDALCEHLAERVAAALPEGERAEVHITDVRRAGAFEPAAGATAQAVRVVRDVHPPRIALGFKRLSPDGRTLAEGSRTLPGLAFQMRGDRYPGDKLRHEKTLIDDWVAQEFSARRP